MQGSAAHRIEEERAQPQSTANLRRVERRVCDDGPAVSVTRTFTLRHPRDLSPPSRWTAFGHNKHLEGFLNKQTCEGGKGTSEVHGSDCGSLSSLGCLGGSGAPEEYDSRGRRQRTVMGRVPAGSHPSLS